MTSSRPPIFPLLLVNFIGSFGYSLVLPFLVVLVVDWGGNETIYGLIGATYALCQFVCAPLLGRLSDSMGRRRVLIITQLGTFVAWIAFLLAFAVPDDPITSIDNELLGSFALTAPLLLLIGARAVDGITGGNVSVANALLADISTDDDRDENFGKMAAASNLGTVAGPALAGLLGALAIGELLPVLVAATIAAVGIGVVRRIPTDPSGRPRATHHHHVGRGRGVSRSFGHSLHSPHVSHNDHGLRRVLQLPYVPRMFAIYFLDFLAFSLFYVAMPVIALETYDWGTFEIGAFFAAMALLTVVSEGPVLRHLSRRYPDSILILAGSLLLATGFLVFAQGEEWTLVAGVAAFALGNGLLWPSFLASLANVAPDDMQGAVQGYASSVGSLANMVGLTVGGIVVGTFGPDLFYAPAILMTVIAVVTANYIHSQAVVSHAERREAG